MYIVNMACEREDTSFIAVAAVALCTDDAVKLCVSRGCNSFSPLAGFTIQYWVHRFKIGVNKITRDFKMIGQIGVSRLY